MPRSRERPLLDTTRSISAAAPTRSATRNAPLAGRRPSSSLSHRLNDVDPPELGHVPVTPSRGGLASGPWGTATGARLG